MRATLLGTSTINIPFAFPSGTVAGKMAYYNAPDTSSSRAEQITALYWDGIDEKAIKPLDGGHNKALELKVMTYLVEKGISKSEAAAFANAMNDLPDKSWLVPKWSLTKTVLQDTTGTGYQGSGGSKSGGLVPDWLKTATLLGLGVAALLVARPYVAPFLPRRK
jgi:hypothetical protein